MARPVKRGVGKRLPKAAKVSPRPVVKERVAILESEEEMDKLYQDFELDDNNEINDIVSGRIGEIAVEW
jgi:hypothetical protein